MLGSGDAACRVQGVCVVRIVGRRVRSLGASLASVVILATALTVLVVPTSAEAMPFIVEGNTQIGYNTAASNWVTTSGNYFTASWSNVTEYNLSTVSSTLQAVGTYTSGSNYLPAALAPAAGNRDASRGWLAGSGSANIYEFNTSTMTTTRAFTGVVANAIATSGSQVFYRSGTGIRYFTPDPTASQQQVDIWSGTGTQLMSSATSITTATGDMYTDPVTGKIFVATSTGMSVLSGASVAGTIAISNPVAMSMVRDGGYVMMSDSSGNVRVYNTNTLALVATYATGLTSPSLNAESSNSFWAFTLDSTRQLVHFLNGAQTTQIFNTDTIRSAAAYSGDILSVLTDPVSGGAMLIARTDSWTNNSGTGSWYAYLQNLREAIIPSYSTNLPSAQTVVLGNSITLNGVFSSATWPLPTAWNWYKSTDNGSTWAMITSTSTSSGGGSYTFTPSLLDTGTLYRASTTNVAGSSNTATLALTVVSVPTITTQPSNFSVGIGGTATFSAVGAGVPTPTAQWQKSTNSGVTWANISGATSSTLSFTAASGDAGNQYRVVYTNAYGTVTSNAATLTAVTAATITNTDHAIYSNGNP